MAILKAVLQNLYQNTEINDSLKKCGAYQFAFASFLSYEINIAYFVRSNIMVVRIIDSDVNYISLYFHYSWADIPIDKTLYHL